MTLVGMSSSDVQPFSPSLYLPVLTRETNESTTPALQTRTELDETTHSSAALVLQGGVHLVCDLSI